MTIKKEVCNAWEVRQNAWSGACNTLDLLTDDEIEMIISFVEECYPEGMTETEFNDFLWFDTDYIAEMLGYADFETMYTERS